MLPRHCADVIRQLLPFRSPRIFGVLFHLRCNDPQYKQDRRDNKGKRVWPQRSKDEAEKKKVPVPLGRTLHDGEQVGKREPNNTEGETESKTSTNGDRRIRASRREEERASNEKAQQCDEPQLMTLTDLH